MSGPRWEWCICTREKLAAEKVDCPGCQKSVRHVTEQVIHLGDRHFHLTCALDMVPVVPEPEPHHIDLDLGMGWRP